jgi:uncharacterized repeat protein (TIGR03803 family)
MTRTTQHKGLVFGLLRRAASLAPRLAVVLVLTVVSMQSANARTYYHEAVIRAFTGLGADGANPIGPTATLLPDGAGNLYGTTAGGGAWGDGNVFKIDKTGKQTVLHSFNNTNGDGSVPNGGLVMDSSGNLYGTTRHGGANGMGTVFKIQPMRRGYKETVFHDFAGGANDGALPLTGLIQDPQGNLYGATYNGGTCGAQNGNGTLFKLDTNGQVTVIYMFGCNPDEGTQVAGLARDSQGNFYAASETGGPSQYFYNCIQNNWLPSFGCGTLAKIDPSGKETLLHVFTGVNGDGGSPMGAVLINAAGDIYGTTLLGGSGSCQPKNSSTPGCGTVFKIDAAGRYSVIYSFPGNGTQGAGPVGELTMDTSGNLYGATEDGGFTSAGTCVTNSFAVGGYYTAYPGCGVIFKLTAARKETVLYKFTGHRDGGNPESGGFILDSSGNLYGTTYDGGDDNGCGAGYGCGVVFKISK